MEKKDPDLLLAQVISQARSVSIPVSGRIDPHVAVNPRPRTRFGCCRARQGGYSIELSRVLLSASEAAIRQVLAHEILHTCPGCANHGPRWQHWAQEMNRAFGYDIRRTHAPEALGVEDPRPVRYLVACRQCGRSIPRMKRSPLVEHPERYRCQCGGALSVTRLCGDREAERRPLP